MVIGGGSSARHGFSASSLLTLAALAWGGGLAVLGFWALIRGVRLADLAGVSIGAPRFLDWTLGVTAVCAGQLVFLVFVADRVFPHVDRRVRQWGELACAAVMLAGVAVGCVGLVVLYGPLAVVGGVR